MNQSTMRVRSIFWPGITYDPSETAKIREHLARQGADVSKCKDGLSVWLISWPDAHPAGAERGKADKNDQPHQRGNKAA